MERQNHRVAIKLVRDVIETLDLAAYFHAEIPAGTRHLENWYNNEVIPHRVYRDYLQESGDEAAAADRRKMYGTFSRFTHRTYKALLEGYTLGAEDRLVHDSISLNYGRDTKSNDLLVARQTTAAYYATIAEFILLFAGELASRGVVEMADVNEAIKQSLEPDTAPRRFRPVRAVLEVARMEAKAKATEEGPTDPNQ